MGRHIRRPRSDLDLICPSFMTANVPYGIDYPYLSLTLRLHTYKCYLYLLFCNTMLCLELLGVCIQALYTNFFASRQRRLLVFRRSGFSTTWSTLTPIQRHVFSAASIALPTRILPLLAIAKAPQRRFGVPPSTPHKSPCTIQRLSLGIPNSFDLTYSSRLS